MSLDACPHWETYQDDDGTFCDECGLELAPPSPDDTPPHGIPRPADL